MDKIDLKDKTLLEIYKMVLSGELKKFPYGIWKGEEVKYECKKIIRYFIEEVLQCKREEIPIKVTYSKFKKYKLTGMLQHVFDHSPYEAINFAYPGEFKRWEFGNFSRHNWNRSLAAEAMQWLIEEKLRISYDEALRTLTESTIYEYGLGYIFEKFHNRDIKRAVLDAQSKAQKIVS